MDYEMMGTPYYQYPMYDPYQMRQFGGGSVIGRPRPRPRPPFFPFFPFFPVFSLFPVPAVFLVVSEDTS